MTSPTTRLIGHLVGHDNMGWTSVHHPVSCRTPPHLRYTCPIIRALVRNDYRLVDNETGPGRLDGQHLAFIGDDGMVELHPVDSLVEAPEETAAVLDLLRKESPM